MRRITPKLLQGKDLGEKILCTVPFYDRAALFGAEIRFHLLRQETKLGGRTKIETPYKMPTENKTVYIQSKNVIH